MDGFSFAAPLLVLHLNSDCEQAAGVQKSYLDLTILSSLWCIIEVVSDIPWCDDAWNGVVAISRISLVYVIIFVVFNLMCYFVEPFKNLVSLYAYKLK